MNTYSNNTKLKQKLKPQKPTSTKNVIKNNKNETNIKFISPD